MVNSINTNQLTPGDSIMIRGRLQYSRLTSKIQGEELAKRNRGQRYPITTPYTTATICDAQIITKNPSHPSLFEQWAQNHLYTSKAEGTTGYAFSANNKGNSLPWIGVEESKGNVHQVYPEGELAKDLQVTLVLSVFKTSQNNGVGLDGVIIHEPLRLFSPNDATSVLKQHGYNFIAENPPVQNEINPTAQANGVQPGFQSYEDNNYFDESVPMYDNPVPNQMPQNPFGQNDMQGGIRYNPQDRGY